MASATQTRDHDEIRRWVEERGGIPTIVDETRGLLRVDFIKGPKSGGRNARLDEVSWDEWFRIFDDNDLVFLHQPEGESRFFKLVSSETAGENEASGSRRRGRSSRAGRRGGQARGRRGTAAAKQRRSATGRRKAAGRSQQGRGSRRRGGRRTAGRRGVSSGRREAARTARQRRSSSRSSSSRGSGGITRRRSRKGARAGMMERREV